mmetsp:Transcript_39479/g.72833  ORF Transcript_39479/g.72833 Transcript_39479/m.72833 type:complete len:118 (-) Transcript_39479:1068-1421(-)
MFQKGVSANPGGRPKLSEETKQMIQATGDRAVQLLHETLKDPEAFGKKGWVPLKEQLKWIEAAITRAHGKPESISISHQHHGRVEHQRVAEPVEPPLVRPVIDAVALPERQKMKAEG